MIFNLNVSELLAISGGQGEEFRNGGCDDKCITNCYTGCDNHPSEGDPYGMLCKSNCRGACCRKN